ncbi:phosphate ABC transporter permease subunit PstC [Roseateles sp. LKC17W]|uniref:Phosphate transport system permease protein n=1 Tax=Pelomonas margarita TaxID=3299031 RepID=A0ABW7FDM0_9BURK
MRITTSPFSFASRHTPKGDVLMWSFFAVASFLASLILVLIVAFLLGEAGPLVTEGGFARFFTDPGWWPKEQSFNMTAMLVSSLLLTVGATLVAAPFAVAVAVFMVFMGPAWLTQLMRRLVEASAAVPTVVYGLWGVTTVVPALNAFHPPGASLLAGIVVLALMVMPTLTILSREALQAVPDSFMQASSALGVSRARTLAHVVLPAAWPGICASLVLGAARAIGETMAVLMVCGNIVQTPNSLFDPVRALTSNIALEMPYAMGTHRSSLFVAGLMVLLLVTVLVMIREGAVRERQGAGS